MPRYFFDTLDGEHVIDQDGEVLPDKETARQIATRIVAELTPSKSPDLWCGEPFKVVLRDDNNRVVGSLTVTATREPDA
jgi:hypothetical protein